ncbi:unnamed protein product [Caenorhabditis brenneri]
MNFEVEEKSPSQTQGVTDDQIRELQEKFGCMTITEEPGEHSVNARNGRNLLLNMPEEPLIEILNNFSFVTLQVLRKTCNLIRRFIDKQNRDPNFESLRFEFADDSIELTIYPNPNPNDNKMILTYIKTEDDTKILCENNEIKNEKLVKGASFVEIFSQDFRILTEKSKFIPFLQFYFKTKNPPENLLKNFQKIMNFRNFRTIKLHFEVHDARQILAILPSFDPNFLKTLTVSASEKNLHEWKVLMLKEVVELEQWRRVENVHIEYFEVDHPTRFKHLNQCNVSFDTFTSADMEILMEAYLHSTSFPGASFYSRTYLDVSRMLRILGDHGFVEDEESPILYRTRWFYKHPSGVLEVDLTPNLNSVVFIIRKLEEVPAGAIVKGYNMIGTFFSDMSSEEELPVPVPDDPMKEIQEKFDSMTLPEEHGKHSAHGSEENGRNLLLNMPEEPLIDIFSYCDFVSVQSLRKTCDPIRAFIDKQNQDPNFESLGFKFAEDYIELFLYSELFETEIELTYKKTENSTTLVRKTKKITHEKIIRDVNFIDLFCQDFRVLTENAKQIPYIFFTIETDNLPEILFQKFQEVLKIRNFKTLKLAFYVSHSGHILSILPFFDPNFLITLYVQDSDIHQHRILDLTEVVKLEQWRRLKNVHIEGIDVQHPIKFKHFDKCHVSFDSFTRDDLELIMEAYLHSTSFFGAHLHFPSFSVPLSQLHNVLGDHGFEDYERGPNWPTRWYNMIGAFVAEMISKEESLMPVPNDSMKEMQEKFDSMTLPEEYGEHSTHGREENGCNLLLNMPEGPLIDIFSYCDFVAVQSLRKTCLSIREFIDYQHIDPNFECLGFKFAENSIKLYLYSEIFDTEMELTYKKTESSTTIIRKKNEITYETTIRDVNFVDLFCQDFLALTESSKRIPYIFFTIQTDNRLESLFEKFQEILKMRNFKTSKLVFHVRDSAHIFSLLPFFDSNFLKTLYVQDSGTDQHSILNLTEVAKLEQWRRQENVHIEFFEAERPMTFKDFNLLRIQPELTWTFR